VSGNLVYVLSDTQLYAFASSDGALRWRQNLQPTLGNTAKLLVRNGVLYSVNGSNLTALRADSGSIQWQFSLDPGLGESISDIFIAGSTLLVWSPTTLDGLDASSGHALWHKETQAKDLRVVGSTIYTIFIDGPDGGLGNIVTGLRALHLPDGTQLWQVNTPVQDGQASVITDDTFFRAVGPTGGDVEARGIQDGHLLWQVPSGNTFVSLVADDGILYLETQQGEVDARQVTDGKLLWQRQEAGGEMSFSLQDDLLYLVSKNSGVVLALDPATGTSRWHDALGNSLGGFMVADE
jgi:outer membrane protein assembly factor BamB